MLKFRIRFNRRTVKCQPIFYVISKGGENTAAVLFNSSSIIQLHKHIAVEFRGKKKIYLIHSV